MGKQNDNSDSPVPITKDTKPSDTKPKGQGDEGKTKEQRGGK